MLKKKTIAVLTAGAGAGIAQTFVLREYVDKVYGKIPGLDALGGFGTYSAMAGIVGGGITTALGLVSVLTGKITRNETIQIGLIGYGIPALSGGILSGVFPHPAVELGLRLRAPGTSATQIKLKSAGIPNKPPGQVMQNVRAPANRAVSQAVGQTGAIPLRT